MDTEEVVDAELEAWREDPITVRVIKGLEQAQQQASNALFAACQNSTDPEVRHLASTLKSIEILTGAMKAGKL